MESKFEDLSESGKINALEILESIALKCTDCGEWKFVAEELDQFSAGLCPDCQAKLMRAFRDHRQ